MNLLQIEDLSHLGPDVMLNGKVDTNCPGIISRKTQIFDTTVRTSNITCTRDFRLPLWYKNVGN